MPPGRLVSQPFEQLGDSVDRGIGPLRVVEVLEVDVLAHSASDEHGRAASEPPEGDVHRDVVADDRDVLPGHADLLEDDVDAAESALSEREVYERDIRWLDACDLLIAEASGSSYGVGFEVGYVLGRSDRSNQRVLVLYDVARRGAVSRLLLGNSHPRCTTIGYVDAADLLQHFDAFLARR